MSNSRGQEYEFHPYASVLPMLGTSEANELAADIQANGLRMDIVLLDGKILDGRNRYKACKVVGVEPRFRDFNGEGDPVDYIVSVNVRRRHLTTAQRELVAAKLANLPRGDISRFSSKTSQTAKRQNGTKTVTEAAKELDVSPRNVARAKEAIRTADPKDIEAIERGEKKVGTVLRETREKAAAKEPHLDKTGYAIPDSILEDWQAAESFRSTLNDLQRIKLQIEKAIDKRELIYREVGQDTVADLKNAWTALKQVLPYAVCPTCQGRTRSKCSVCKQRGFVSEFGYTHWFAKEVIELREKAIKK